MVAEQSPVAAHHVSCLVRMPLTLLLDSEVSVLLLLSEVSDQQAEVAEVVVLPLLSETAHPLVPEGSIPLDPQERLSVAHQD